MSGKDFGVGMYVLDPDFVIDFGFRKLTNKGNTSYHLCLSLGWYAFEIFYGNMAGFAGKEG